MDEAAMSCVMSVDDHGLSLRLIATLEKIQKFISDWIQQEKDEALLYEENLCNNCCAFLSTVIMEDDEVDSIELCIFLFGANMNDLTLEMFGFNCSGQLRGKSSIVAVYLDKYTSDLTLQQRLSPDAIKLLNAWERKRACANLVALNVEVEREILSVIEFEIIDSFGGMHGRLKGIVPITSYAEKLNAAYRKSLEKYDNLKFEYDKISEQLSEIARKEGKKRKSDKIKEGMTKASLKKMGKMDDDNNFTSEQIEKAVTQRIVTNIKDACNTPQKLNTVMNNLVETFSNAHTDINLAKLTLADNFVTYFKVLYTLVQCFPKHKDLSPDAVNFRELEGKLNNALLMAVGPTGKQGISCKKNSGVFSLLEMKDRSKHAKRATDRRALLANSCDTHIQIDEHNKCVVGREGHKILHRFFQQPTRKLRKDKLTEKDIMNIADGWFEMSEVSPNTNDQITRRDYNGTETKYFRYNCFNRVVDIKNYLLNVKGLTYSNTSVGLHKPFNVKKGKNDTCMCSVCENAGLMQLAVIRNSKVLNRPTRLVKAYRVLSLLVKAIKLRYSLRSIPWVSSIGETKIVVSVRHCYIVVAALFHNYYDFPVQTIVDVCRGAHRSQICQRLMCFNALPKYGARNKKECGRARCLGEVSKGVECARCSKSQNMLLHEDIKADESDRIGELMKHLKFGTPDQSEKDWIATDSISYSAWANEEGTKVDSLLKVWEKTPIEFVTYFKEKIYEYAHHVNVLTRQRNNAVLFHKNAKPHQLVGDIDFSQNLAYTDAHRNQIQSAHWTGESVTLFTTVFRYLDLDIWLEAKLSLMKGDEVSFFDDTTNLYHHAIVFEDWSPTTTEDTTTSTEVLVKVRLSDIKVDGVDLLLTARRNLHRRVWIAEPHITASDDKQHDTSFVQHYLQHVALGEKGFVKSHLKLKDQISEFHVHSDGAPGHFKQKYTLQSLNDLLIRNIGHGITRIVWEFGCPGHGKGIYSLNFVITTTTMSSFYVYL